MDLSNILLDWYSVHKRNLPWRETRHPYFIWLSEIILQQTQIKQGLPYYIAFSESFPTVFDLAKAEEITVLNLWQGLGYYSRARNLHATAQYIANELNGVFPDNYNDLLKLKGVGDYTASAIASICFNEPTPVIDGNVYRFLSRYFGVHTPINTTSGNKEFKNLANQLIDQGNPGDFNQAIMEFGARQCTPQNPDCTICPLKHNCRAFQNNLISELPVKIRSKKVKKRYFNYLVLISDDKKTLIEERRNQGIWEKLYQFPLVETQKEINSKTLTQTKEFKNLIQGNNYSMAVFKDRVVVHKLSHQHLHAKFWIITLNQLPKNGVPFNEIKNYPFPTLINNFIKEYNF